MCIIVSAQTAETYKITHLYPKHETTIEIGSKLLKEGDSFSGADKIIWNSDAQVMKAVGNDHKTHTFVATAFKSKKANNVVDYLTHINRASTRGSSVDATIKTPANGKKSFPEKRVALLIANTNYLDRDTLSNPVYDCSALTAKLAELGFDVYAAYDCSLSQMNTAIKDFTQRANYYDVALFFYSGHGIQDDGNNYLLPIDRGIKKNKKKLHKCITCNAIKEQLKGTSCKTKILLFDACRAPMAESSDNDNAVWGQMEGSAGTIISFSTKSGEYASDGLESDNSPFTISLLKYIDEPNVKLQDLWRNVMQYTLEITDHKQEPTYSGILLEDFYFNPMVLSVVIDQAPGNYNSSPNNQPQNTPDINKANELYRNGNYKEAFLLYHSAAIVSQVKLAQCYEQGKGVEQDYDQAFYWYNRAAERGDTIAQLKLGYCYKMGYGTEQNDSLAAKWYHEAAKQGMAEAQGAIGLCYYFGKGVPLNFTKASEWFQQAADKGNAKAQNNIGLCYYYGKGVPLNYDKAAKWFQMAADQDNTVAQANIGRCYKDGQGVPQDYTKAAEWFQIAAYKKDAGAQMNLGLCYDNGQGVPQDYVKAAKWYHAAAEQNDPEGISHLGVCYLYGQGVPQNYDEALKCFITAADKGIALAQYNLGICYENGLGVNQDNNEAVKWYQMAAQQGDEDSINALKRLGEQ